MCHFCDLSNENTSSLTLVDRDGKCYGQSDTSLVLNVYADSMKTILVEKLVYNLRGVGIRVDDGSTDFVDSKAKCFEDHEGRFINFDPPQLLFHYHKTRESCMADQGMGGKDAHAKTLLATRSLSYEIYAMEPILITSPLLQTPNDMFYIPQNVCRMSTRQKDVYYKILIKEDDAKNPIEQIPVEVHFTNPACSEILTNNQGIPQEYEVKLSPSEPKSYRSNEMLSLYKDFLAMNVPDCLYYTFDGRCERCKPDRCLSYNNEGIESCEPNNRFFRDGLKCNDIGNSVNPELIYIKKS